MQIQTIWKWFEALQRKFESFEWKFSPFEPKFKAFECKFKPFEQDSKNSNAYSSHSKWILTIPIQIGTIRTKLEAFEC